MRRVWIAGLVYTCCAATAIGAGQQLGDSFFDAIRDPTIGYYTRPARDPVAELNRRIRDGAVQLQYDATHGYLRSLLAALQVPIESQMTVFSRSSIQAPLISPPHPRAIFFNDSVVVAWP